MKSIVLWPSVGKERTEWTVFPLLQIFTMLLCRFEVTFGDYGATDDGPEVTDPLIYFP